VANKASTEAEQFLCTPYDLDLRSMAPPPPSPRSFAEAAEAVYDASACKFEREQRALTKAADGLAATEGARLSEFEVAEAAWHHAERADQKAECGRWTNALPPTTLPRRKEYGQVSK